MSLIANIQNSLVTKQYTYQKMEKAFQDLCQELHELKQYRNFVIRNYLDGVTIDYLKNQKFYCILSVHLSSQGVLYFRSWKYQDGKHFEVDQEFKEPKNYLLSTASLMICNRLSDLGIFSLEKM